MTQSKPLPLNGAGVRFFSSCSRRFRRALLCFCSRRCRRRPSCISWCSTCFVAGVQQVVGLLFSRPAHRSWYLCPVLPQGAHLSRGTAQGSRTRTLPHMHIASPAKVPRLHSPFPARRPLAYCLCAWRASRTTRRVFVPMHGLCIEPHTTFARLLHDARSSLPRLLLSS